MTHTYCLHTATTATAAWAGAQARDIPLALPAEPWDARLRWPAWTCCQPCLPCPEATKEARGHWAQAWVSTHPQPGLPEALTALDLSRECAENRWADSAEADLPSLLEFATELPEEHSPGERSRDRVQGHGKQGCFG